MNIHHTAFGLWNGGRYMHYGEPVTDDRFIALMRRSYEQGVRTFVTADVYGNGAADTIFGQAMQGMPRDSYALIGIVGHDFYQGQRDGAKGFPRFTNPDLRSPADYAGFLRMATEKSLERCGVDRFDAVLLHNPDRIGYTSDAVWKGMEALREAGLTRSLGVAPGPANGFSLDLIVNFERFGALVDWAMIILNPFEPWPGEFVLGAAEKYGVDIMARVVDFGGIFHDDVRPGHEFAKWDHRSYRPAGWVESSMDKVERIRPVAQRHGLTLLQLACAWTLGQRAVKCVVPTLTQEIGAGARPIDDKLAELVAVAPGCPLSAEEIAFIREIGENRGCMKLKGAHPNHSGQELPDNWPLDADTRGAAERWRIDPVRDLAYAH
ncbi:MAG: aldo/keto reductase [Verrucomicrobiales bacterium]